MSANKTIHLVDDADLCTLVDLAFATPIRSVAQQEALLRVCATLDHDFCSWTGHALATWEGRRCQCGRAIPVTADNCAACVRGETRR